MEISEVKVFPIHEEKLKAFVSIVFDQCFMVNDIKIIQGRDGLFISMPSRKKKNGEFKDVAHPLNNETRRMIEDRVLGEYERVLGERGERLPAPPHHASDSAAAELAPAAAAGTPPASAPAMAAAGAAASRGDGAAGAAAGDGAHGGHGADGADRDGAAAGGTAAFPALASSPADPSGPVAGNEAAGALTPSPKAPEKTLEEIEEMHLRDSFWTVT
jgi:stage V sporulation protein G